MPKRRATAPASIVQAALVSFAVDPCTGPATANAACRGAPTPASARNAASASSNVAWPATGNTRSTIGSAGRLAGASRKRAFVPPMSPASTVSGRMGGVVAWAIESRVPGRRGVEEAAPPGSRAQRWQNSGFGPRYVRPIDACPRPVRSLRVRPLVKTGGLGDVSAALPRRWRARPRRAVLLPGYPRCSPARADAEVARSAAFALLPGARLVAGCRRSGAPLPLVVDCPALRPPRRTLSGRTAATGPTTRCASACCRTSAAALASPTCAARLAAATSCTQRLADRPRAGLPALCRAARGAATRADHPQPRLPGHLRTATWRRAGPAGGERSRSGRRRVLRQAVLPQGRPASTPTRSPRSARRYAREIQDDAARLRPRRPARRAQRRPPRHPQRHRHRRLEPGHRSATCRRATAPTTLAAQGRQQGGAAASSSAWRLRAGRAAVRRGHAAHRAEGLRPGCSRSPPQLAGAAGAARRARQRRCASSSAPSARWPRALPRPVRACASASTRRWRT